MRNLIAALFAAGAIAQSTGDYLKCAVRAQEEPKPISEYLVLTSENRKQP